MGRVHMTVRRRDVLKVATSAAAAVVAGKLAGKNAWAGAPAPYSHSIVAGGLLEMS